ncbi:MAG: hypothetical protein HXX13_00225 [Bacteroidetes bacterium]|nr:hypothetical protein [Bacteroidota bacterium]
MIQTELKELLLAETSRANTDFVGNIVKKKPELIHDLWEIYFRKEEPISRRAAWIIDTVSENHPEWVAPYIPALIDLLPTFNHDGLKRHGLRMLERSIIPDDRQGDLMNICFEWLLSKEEAVAAKMYCMLILHSLSSQVPEIRHELIDTIEFQMAEGTPGFISIGRKILKQLYAATK